MIVASIDQSSNNEPSKSTSWKVLETVLSQLNLKQSGPVDFNN